MGHIKQVPTEESVSPCVTAVLTKHDQGFENVSPLATAVNIKLVSTGETT